MPRKPPKAHQVSLYRLTQVADSPLVDYVQDKYLDRGFQADEVTIEDVGGLLVTGTIQAETVKWSGHVQALTGLVPQVSNETAAAVLLLPVEGYVFALAWGFGHLVIAPSRVDPGFGLRFAIRRANPQQVRSLTIHTMDTLARTARTSVPGGAGVEAFGMDDMGQAISRLVGRIPAQGLAGARGGAEDLLTVRGADGLRLALGRSPADLLSDVQLLHNVVENETPVEGLEVFEYTRPLRPGAPEIDALNDDHLAPALQPGSGRLALSWPSEWDEEHGEASSYKLTRLGKGDWDTEPEELTLDHLVEPLGARDVGDRIAALRRMTVQALNTDGAVISRAIGADKWLTFETELDGRQYVFHQGRWFDIGDAYLRLLDTSITRIFDHQSDLALPPWHLETKDNGTTGPWTEGRYNEWVPTQDGQYLCLDKKLLRTKQHPRGIEACDLLGPDDELIHVKQLKDSVSASHLFNQAVVAVEALRRQPDARKRLRQRVDETSTDGRTLQPDYQPRKVVLAFSGLPARPESLFTFSKVTLLRCARRLEDLDCRLEILGIPSSTEVKDQ